MKKLIFSMLWILIGLSLNISTAHAQDCLRVDFDNGEWMCLNMNKNGNNYKIYPTRYFWLRSDAVICYVILPNNVMKRLDSCNGVFYYNGHWTQNITISAMYNADNTIYNNRLPASVNFSNGSRSRRTSSLNHSNYYNSSTYTSTNTKCNRNNCNNCKDYYCSSNNSAYSNSTSSKSYNNKLELESNDIFPDIDQFINLSIETDNDYTGTLYLSAKYRSPTNTERTSIPNRSYTYFYDYSSTRSNWSYTMSRSDSGNITLKNLIKFKKFGHYRIYVKDIYGKESYIQFSVENTKSENYPYRYTESYGDSYNDKYSYNSNSSKNRNELEIYAYPSTVDTKEWVRVTIETDDNYTWKIYFTKLQYRSTNSSSWKDISRLSSSYIYDYSDQREDGYYKMTRSDEWEKDLYRFIKFNKNWYYRIYIEDTYENKNYVQIFVGEKNEEESDYYYVKNTYSDDIVWWFTSSQLEKVRNIYFSRDNTIGQLQKQYPNLKKDNYRIRLSNNLYNDMKDIINNHRFRNLDDYDDFLEAYNDRYRYTMQNI